MGSRRILHSRPEGHPHPPHIYLDDTWSIITASTIHHAPYLASELAKNLVRDTLQTLVRQLETVLAAWVILDDHYHLLLKTGRGSDLPRFFGRLHGSTSRQISVWDDAIGRQIWHNNWDTCIRAEAGYWTRLNYIHNNPVKHGYVQRWDEWAWSSLHYYLRTKGEEWVLDCWDRHPAIDSLREDDFCSPVSGQSLHSRDRLGADFRLPVLAPCPGKPPLQTLLGGGLPAKPATPGVGWGRASGHGLDFRGWLEADFRLPVLAPCPGKPPLQG